MAKKKKIKTPNLGWVILAAIGLIVVGLVIIKSHKSAFPLPTTGSAVAQQSKFDFSNQQLILNNQKLKFINGNYVASGHTAMILNHSLNPSQTAAAAILVDNPGGSASLVYLVGGSLKYQQERYSKPILLGDRIKVVDLQVANPGNYDNGIITVQLLNRKPSEPMSAEPKQKITKKYAFQEDGNLIEVVH